MSNTWFFTPSNKNEKNGKKHPGKSTNNNSKAKTASNKTVPVSVMKAPDVSHGSSDNTNIQPSVHLQSPATKSTLTSTDENIPAYFTAFMKTMNDQFNQLFQEFSTHTGSTTTENTTNLPHQVQIDHHSDQNKSECDDFLPPKNAPTSNSTHELVVDFPQDPQSTKTFIKQLIDTVRTEEKQKLRRTTYSDASTSQQENMHQSTAYFRATRSHAKTARQKSFTKQSYSDVRLKHDLANFGMTDDSIHSSDSDQSSSLSINMGTISQFRIPPVPFVTPQPCPQFDISKFNREMKSVSIDSEDYPAITSLYDDV
jgi:hypothetical protein